MPNGVELKAERRERFDENARMIPKEPTKFK